ncbi:MAG: hypothetical protein DYG89_23110 [Caldilinea sp. CFX5]|nr:hypothetical protein [Caldilinea sp. CFX5]
MTLSRNFMRVLLICLISLVLFEISYAARKDNHSSHNFHDINLLENIGMPNDESEWLSFADQKLQITFQYPADWYLFEDSTFRSPQPVSGAAERRAIVTNFKDPLSIDIVPESACWLEVFVNDAPIGQNYSLASAIGKRPDQSETATLRNGLVGYRLRYGSLDIDQHNYTELFLPYDQGTLIFVYWSKSSTNVQTCEIVFASILDSLEVLQINNVFSADILSTNTDSIEIPSFIPKTLELPLAGPHLVQQGWHYDFTTAPHKGIDYRGETWQSFDVLAAAAGDAKYIHSDSWGHTVIIKHTVSFESSNRIYYTLYAHLDTWNVPSNGQWQRVYASEKIGTSGISGKANGYNHLHFEVSFDSYGSNRFDPYALWNVAKYYPSGGAFTGYGPNHIWLYEDAASNVGVTLFEEPNFKGHSLTLTTHDLDLCDNPLGHNQPAVVPCFTAPSWTDNASSIKVAPGWNARLHKHNEADAVKWGDDATKGLSCNSDISDFRTVTFPDGTPLDQNVSRIYVWRCGGLNSLVQPASYYTDQDPCKPDTSTYPTADKAQFNNKEFPADTYIATPNQSLNKMWELRNTGSTTWGSGYQLVFLGGDQMGAPKSVNVPTTAPNSTVQLTVPIVAPAQPGTYRGNWQLRNPQGTYFGEKIWVQLTIADPNSNTVEPSGNLPSLELTCLECPTTLGTGELFRPKIRVKVNSGDLLASRGDMLRNTDNNLFGAFPHVAVEGSIREGQSYDFVFYADHPFVAPTTPAIYTSKWRIWRDGGYVGPEVTIRFEAKPAAPPNLQPNPPRLTGPGDWAVYQGNSGIQLAVQNAGDPDGDAITSYYFEIFESAQNANSGWINANSWTPPATLGFNNYQWRAKVRDGRGGESAWSNQVWHFTILNSALQISDFHAETCRIPWGGAEKICFCATTNAGTLKLQINTANDGSASGDWHTINELGTPNYNCASDNDRPPNLDPFGYLSGSHKVRLYARGAGGWENAAYRDITINIPANSKPGVPYGLAPQNNGYLATRNITFDWIDTHRTTSYVLQAATDANFTALLLNTTLNASQSNYVWTAGAEYATVYWRVIANGPYGANTAGQSLHIDETAPNSAFVGMPSISYDTKFNLQWSGSDARAGLRWYHIQVRDGNYADSEWVDWLVNTTKTTEIFAGQAGHIYYFRIRAMDEVGNWEAWPGADGDGAVLIDPTAMPTTPWWNNSYTTKRNLIITNQDSDTMPAGFPLRIHFDPTTNPTAAEIFNASQSSTKGNDLRVIYNNQTELDRWVQRFTATQIDIWFPLQAVLGSSQTNNSSYQLYYGNAQAGAPPANQNAIFLPKTDGNTMGLWHFLEGSGSTVNDVSGRTHPGNFINGGWTDGYLGGAGSFNGSSAYVEISHSDDFKPGALTLEAWIYVTGSFANHPMIFNKDRYWFKINGDGQLTFMIKADGGDRAITGQTRLTPNRWYHVAATYNGGQRMRIFVNGWLDREQNDGAPPVLWNTHPLRIGRSDYNSTGYFPGYIQHARISNSERTDFAYGAIDMLPSLAVGSLIAPPVQGQADLAILNVRTYPANNGKLVIEVTVKNEGNRASENQTYVDLYLDGVPSLPQNLRQVVKFWLNESIAPGQTVFLTTEIQSFGTLLTNTAVADAHLEETHQLYALVDPTNVVKEANETNNVTNRGVDACLTLPDSYEADNTSNEAPVLLLDQVQHHNFTNLADEDWVKFTTESGIKYQFATSNLGAAADTYLYLYDTDGTTLLAANDDARPETLAAQFEWTAAKSATHYLLVKHWNPNISGCGTGYDLLVTKACAAPTPAPSAQIGDLDGDGDVDDADAAILQAAFGSKGCPGWIASDLNQDGLIDIMDHAILVAHFGESLNPPTPTATPTPTPTAIPAIPTTPKLEIPAPNSTVSATQVIVLTWSRPEHATEFIVELFRNGGEFIDKRMKIQTTTWEVGILPAGEYLVRIQAFNRLGQWSEWGDYRFTVVSNTPGPTITPQPTATSTPVPPTPTITPTPTLTPTPGSVNENDRHIYLPFIRR